MSETLMWPAKYDHPADLAVIEAVPLQARQLPGTTYDLLTRAAEHWPDRTALHVLPDAERWRTPRRRTFRTLLADVHRYANTLHTLGVRRGDAVALMAPNCSELVTATLAGQLAGIIAPLNPGLGLGHLRELLRRSGARTLLAAGPELAADTWENALTLAREGLLDTLLALRPTLTADPAPALPQLSGVRTGFLQDLAAEQDPAVFHGAAPGAGDFAAFFHTGGTTGTPKLAAHTHTNQVANAWMLAANTTLAQDSVLFAGLPLFHVNALVVTLLAPLFKGQAVVWAGPLGYREPALYAEFWRIVENYRVAVLSAVPTVYAFLAQCPVDADITSLRFAAVGASVLPEAVRTAFQDSTGVALVEGYGLTEATCASAGSFPGVPVPGSVGQRLPYLRIRAVDVRPDGGHRSLRPGETGMLVVQGPTVFAGYVAGRDDRGNHLVRCPNPGDGGWLETGDLGHVDAQGFVHLSGRAKDLIIRGGHNIDPAVIEDALLAHPQVTGAAAVARPDRRSGEIPVAYVTLSPDASATEAELGAWAAAQVSERAAVPRTVHILDELPLTAVGKPYKVALRRDAAQRELNSALAHLDGVEVRAEIADGAVAVRIHCATDTDEKAAVGIASQYGIPWRVVRRP
ncbi:acyl-CoA synthetase [Streptacidiphilus sp. N1-3]|uniref:Acyl-CoA synthetase n=1 Tax=Streptacidiphilus alkalitolerans TaxID=3342712 RepID=A0ABV6WZW2_9ACTN